MRAAFILVFLASYVFPSPSVNGVKIVTRQVTSGLADTRTEYVTADSLRSEWQTVPGSAMASIIRSGERQRVFLLDLQAHEYVTYETDSRGLALGPKPRPITDSGGTLQIWIDNIDTGERKEIFGHLARHIISKEKRVAGPGACSGNSESETDGWYVDVSILPEWRQPRKTMGGVVVASAVTSGSPANCLYKVDKIELHRAGSDLGFPVKLTTTLQSEVKEHDRPKLLVSTWGSEVMELRAGPLDAALFEVPPDFHLVDRLHNFAAAPRHQPSGWEWFKEKLDELFR